MHIQLERDLSGGEEHKSFNWKITIATNYSNMTITYD